MKLEASAENKDAAFYIIYDIDNDCVLQGAIPTADDEKGEYEKATGRDKKTGNWIIKKMTGNIKLIDSRLPQNYELIKRISPLTIDHVSKHFYTIPG